MLGLEQERRTEGIRTTNQTLYRIFLSLPEVAVGVIVVIIVVVIIVVIVIILIVVVSCQNLTQKHQQVNATFSVLPGDNNEKPKLTTATTETGEPRDFSGVSVCCTSSLR